MKLEGILFQAYDFGYRKYYTEDLSDYLGRQVVMSKSVYTVVSVRPATKNEVRYDYNKQEYINNAYLYLVSDEIDNDGEVKTNFIFASNIAEPCKTAIHWHKNVTWYRKASYECRKLYKIGKQADRKRKRKYATMSFLEEQKKQRIKDFFEKNTPIWSKSYIIAEYQIDESEPISDYFGTGIKEQVLLGFSKHIKNDARELKKFAVLFDETKELAINYKVENYEGYKIMSPKMGIFSDGWTVRKEQRVNYSKFNFEHYLYNILPTLE